MSDPATKPLAVFGKDKYRYVLQTEQNLKLPKSIYISAIHKTDRRDMASTRAFLVRAFFAAVAAEATIPPTLAGGITNQINRFAIAVFEEGSFLHLCDTLRGVLIQLLLDVQKARAESRWVDCARMQVKVVTLTRGVARGRLGSVAARHVLDGRPTKDAPSYVVEGLAPERLSEAYGSREAALAAVNKHLPVASKLLVSGCKYGECGELRRVLHMNALVASCIPTSALRAVPETPLSRVAAIEPTMQDLIDIGVVDCHVKGKHRVDAWDEFLDHGCRVANPTSAVVFGLDYKNLEANYVAGKRADAAAGKTPKRSSSTREAPPSKRPRVAAPRDVDVFAVEKRDRILGFKKATSGAVLLADVSPLRAGQRVFVKLGETESNFRFAVECYRQMGVLGMPTVEAAVTPVAFSLEWWKAYAHRTDTNEDGKWAAAMIKHMTSVVNKTGGEALPLFVAAEFAGERLQHVARADARLASDNFGRTLVQTLFFSKRVGAKDLGAFNLMVDGAGRVLQVDLNRVEPASFAKYNAKGLQTSHRFDSALWGRATAYARAHPDEVADFVAQLAATVPPTPGLADDLFSDDYVAAMRANPDAAIARWTAAAPTAPTAP